jgi:GRIP domain
MHRALTQLAEVFTAEHCAEQANREKEDAVAKLNMARGMSSGSAAGQHSNGSSSSNGQSESPLEALEAKYAALKEEYKLYRKKAMAALQSGGGAPSAGTPRSSGHSGSTSSTAAAGAHADGSLSSSSGRGHRPHRADSFSAGSGDEAKMAYLRNLLLKYLGTEETVARQHMERAMGAVFSFSPAELAAVKEQREKAAAAATGAWLAGVSSLLGGNKGS